jgi:hypothetical protein
MLMMAAVVAVAGVSGCININNKTQQSTTAKVMPQ